MPVFVYGASQRGPQTIAAAAGNLGIDTKVYGFDATIVSRAFDDSKVGAHMGIIPTAISIDAKAKFKENERRVYEAIALHYLVQFMPPAKKEMTKLVILLPGYGSLTATASSYIQPGYRTLLKGPRNHPRMRMARIQEMMRCARSSRDNTLRPFKEARLRRRKPNLRQNTHKARWLRT